MKSISFLQLFAWGWLFLFQETWAQEAFGMDTSADTYAAGGMMGMTASTGGGNFGQGGSFVTAQSRGSEEVRIVAAAGNGSLCWGIVDSRMGALHRVVGLQPCSPRSHAQKWLLRRTGSNLQIHPALFTQECMEFSLQPNTGTGEIGLQGGELEWSRLQTAQCQPQHSPLAVRQSFRIDTLRRLAVATNQNLCVASSGDAAGSVLMAVKCDDSHLQRVFISAYNKARAGTSWFTELFFAGAEEPHCLGANSISKLLQVEPCKQAGLALSRQLYTVLGGGEWVLLQPSAQWGMCIGLEVVHEDQRGQMHEEAQAAGHHIMAQRCTEDHVGQGWIFDEWDRLRVPHTDWCISAPIATGSVEGLVSLQACSHAKEQRFFVHPHQIARQVAPEDRMGQAYGMGRGTESGTLFGPYAPTPRIHAPAAPGVQLPPQHSQPINPPTPPPPASPAGLTPSNGNTAGSGVEGSETKQAGDFLDGVRRGNAFPEGQRRSEQDGKSGVTQAEFSEFCKQALASGASAATLQVAGCPPASEQLQASPPLPSAGPVPSPQATAAPVVPEPAVPSPVQQQQQEASPTTPAPVPVPVATQTDAQNPAPYQRPPPIWKRKSPPYNYHTQAGPSPPLASHQQRHLQETPSGPKQDQGHHGYLSRNIPVHTMHEHELKIVHWLVLGGSILLILVAAAALISVRFGKPRKIRSRPGPLQMLRNASQRQPPRINPRPAASKAAAEEQYGQALSPTAHAKMMARSGGRFNSIPGLRSSVKSRGGSSDQGQFNL